MNETSIGLRFLDDIPAMEEELTLMRRAGFENFDLDLCTPSVRRLFHDEKQCRTQIDLANETLDGLKQSIYMAHGPYRPYEYGNPEKSAANIEDMRLSIPVAGALHIPYLIIHPALAEPFDLPLFDDRQKIIEMNVELYKELVDLGAKHGVSICMENLFSKAPTGLCTPAFSSCSQDLLDVMDRVPGLYMCLDYGHAMVSGQSATQMVLDLGPRLKALHLHSNNRKMDMHMAPFECVEEPWQEFSRALKKINYTGTINLETHLVYYHMPKCMWPAAFSYLYSCAKQIADWME